MCEKPRVYRGNRTHSNEKICLFWTVQFYNLYTTGTSSMLASLKLVKKHWLRKNTATVWSDSKRNDRRIRQKPIRPRINKWLQVAHDIQLTTIFKLTQQAEVYKRLYAIILHLRRGLWTKVATAFPLDWLLVVNYDFQATDPSFKLLLNTKTCSSSMTCISLSITKRISSGRVSPTQIHYKVWDWK